MYKIKITVLTPTGELETTDYDDITEVELKDNATAVELRRWPWDEKWPVTEYIKFHGLFTVSVSAHKKDD